MTTTFTRPEPPVGAMSWSHILTIIGFAGAFVVQWTAISARQAGVEATVLALSQTISVMENRTKEAEVRSRESDAELRAAVRIIDAKVTQILMQGYRPGQAPPEHDHH